MGKSHTREFCGGTDDIQLLRSIEICEGSEEFDLLTGLPSVQPSSASPRSCSATPVIAGRTDGESKDSNSSCHIWINNVHNTSENPTVGRSGRVPSRTSCTTSISRTVFLKGSRPVTTYRGKMRSHDSGRSGEPIRASRIVIPKAYISVLFDGNFL